MTKPLDERIAEWQDIPQTTKEINFGFSQFVDDLIADHQRLIEENEKYETALWEAYERMVHDPEQDPFRTIAVAIGMEGK
jgi:hypothetical protein